MKKIYLVLTTTDYGFQPVIYFSTLEECKDFIEHSKKTTLYEFVHWKDKYIFQKENNSEFFVQESYILE